MLNDGIAGNTAIGSSALTAATTGHNNTALGMLAGNSLTTGSNNIIIGSLANLDDAARTNAIVMGVGATSATNDDSINIGFGTTPSTYCRIDGIYGQTAAAGVATYINSSGRLGTSTSSARYKTDITAITDEKAQLLLALNPVSFYYKTDAEKKYINYGLIAEEVEQIYPELVQYKELAGISMPETVYYQYLAPLLIKTCQRLSTDNANLHSTVDNLQQLIVDLTARLSVLESRV